MNINSHFRNAMRPGGALVAALLCVSCHDVSSPVGPVPVVVAASLTAISDTSMNGVVGEPALALLVASRSIDGAPVAGTEVRFTISAPSGLSSFADVISDSQGMATLKEWSIGPVAGVTTVTASSAGLRSVVFRVTAMPGPPAKLLKIAGDEQVGPTGEILPKAPSVTVTDTYGNHVAGAVVSFAIRSGNGTLVEPTATSDSAGTAAVGGWKLNSAGRHVLAASVTGIGGVVFNAIAYSFRPDCTQQNELVAGVPLVVELNGNSCRDPDGRRFDELTATPAQVGLYTFLLSSDEFDTNLEIRDASSQIIGYNDNFSAAGNGSRVVALLPSTSVTLLASSNLAAVGKYRISYEVASGLTGCEEWFAVRGVLVDRELAAKPCDRPGDPYGDRYKIFIKAGSSVSIAVQDLSYSPWTLSLYDANEKSVADGVSADPYEIFINFKAAADGFYTIHVNSSDSYSQYRLSIQ